MSEEPKAATTMEKLLRWAVGGGAAGVALALGYALIEAVKQQPEFLPQLLQGGIFSFVALLAALIIFDRRLQGFAALQERHVAAQERLAANVGAMAERQDERTREQEIMTNYLARNSEETLRRIKDDILPQLQQLRERLG